MANDDGMDLFERHVEGAEPADDLGGRDLPGRVVAVAGVRVHRGRLEQPHLVVVAQRFDAEVSGAREVTDGQGCHLAIVNPPVTGQSNAQLPIDPPVR